MAAEDHSLQDLHRLTSFCRLSSGTKPRILIPASKSFTGSLPLHMAGWQYWVSLKSFSKIWCLGLSQQVLDYHVLHSALKVTYGPKSESVSSICRSNRGYLLHSSACQPIQRKLYKTTSSLVFSWLYFVMTMHWQLRSKECSVEP